MTGPRKLLYALSFAALAAAAALSVAHIGAPSLVSPLLLAVVIATLAGGAGLLRRRAGWAVLVLVPFGGYLLLRAQLPPDGHGLGQQLGFYATQLRAGADSYVSQALPFDFRAAPDVRLLVILLVYLAIALAAVAALTLRRVVPAIVILLVPAGFGFTVDQAPRVVWLPLAFLFLAGCTLMLSRSLTRGRWRPADAMAGVGTAVIAALLALSLLGTTSVASGRPWQDWRSWGSTGADSGNTRFVFNWMANYPRLLDPRHNFEVMRVKSTVASYWRANSLEVFTGSNWLSNGISRDRLATTQDGASIVYTVPPRGPQPPGVTVTEVFHTSAISTDYIFSGGAPRFFSMAQDVPIYSGGDDALAVDRRLGPDVQYSVTAVVPQLKPADVIGRGRDYTEDLAPYLELPFPHLADLQGGGDRAWSQAMSGTPRSREWLGLYKLNKRIVGGATDPYQVALLIERYLRFNYTYSLSPPPTVIESPYAAFLFDTRAGYCQHFAGAMAALLRFNGVPARVAVGFTPGRRVNADTFVVTRNDAHAWVEAFFPQVGWVSFDPTPGSSLPGTGPSSTSVGFIDPFGKGSAGGPTPLPQATKVDPSLKQHDPTTGGASGAAGAAKHASRWWLPWLIIAAALVVWPGGRLALRRARLRRGGPERRLRASLELLFLELRDYGLVVAGSQTLEQTARLLGERLGVDAAGVLDRVQAVQFGGRGATAADVAALERLRRETKRRLRARAGLRRRLAAGYGVSARRPLPTSR